MANRLSPSDAHEDLYALLELAGPHAGAYTEFHTKMRETFLEMPASVNGHHCWPGGYAVHICEVVNTLKRLVTANFGPEPKRVSMVDAIISAYVHDIDKLTLRYTRDVEPPTGPQIKKANDLRIPIVKGETVKSLSQKIDCAIKGVAAPDDTLLPRHKYREDFPDMDDSAAVAYVCREHNLPGISLEVLHAVSLHHGGYAPLAREKFKLKVSPLGILLHAADQISAQCMHGEF